MTRNAIQRRAFERAYGRKYEVSLRVGHKARMLFERETRAVAWGRKALAEHAKIAVRELRPAKGAVTRAKHKAQQRAVARAAEKVAPVVAEIPEEFAGMEGMFFGGEEAPEEVDY